jgi:4'-phosphopantetheinyl transferase
VHVWLAAEGTGPLSAAHNLLIALAGTLVGGSPVLTHDPGGRPHVPGLAVSLSRTPSLVVAAASYGGLLGVDLEEVYPREVTALAERWFAPAELEWMAGQPDRLRAFLQLWTAKEAVGKALGQGLGNAGLRRPMPLGGGVVASEPGLLVTYVPWDGLVLALAAPTDLAEIVVHHENADSPVVA